MTVTQYNPRKIADIARKEAGKAEFITLVWHDGELKLNDAGDIAIPSRTKASVCLDMRLSQRGIIAIISGFVSQVNK